MSITPNSTREIGDSCCSKCGHLLLVNDQAIVHEGMANGQPLVFGTCCADLVLGSLIQDYARVLKAEIFAGHWIKRQVRDRLSRIADALEKVLKAYRLAETCPYLSITSDNKSGGNHAA